MKSSKLFLTSLLAAAAMGTSAYATSLTDATLAIESFTTENITALGTAEWNVQGITGSDDTGTFSFSDGGSRPFITVGTSGETLSTQVNGTGRYTFSAIVTVDASLFNGTSAGNIIAGVTSSGSGSSATVSPDNGIGVGFSSGNITGVYNNVVWNNGNNRTLDVSNSIVNGKVTLGLVFNTGDNGVDLYLADGSKVNISALRTNNAYNAICLSDSTSVTYSNLYWFNTALSGTDMRTALLSVSGARQLTWAGGPSGTWDYTNSNWTMPGESEGQTVSAMFSYLDCVTFDTAEASVTVSGSVNPGAMTVSAATSLTGTGTVRVVAANLTTTAALTLGENVVLDLGSSESVVDKNILGSGTVKFVSTSGGYGATLTLGSGFSGTIEYSGKFNTSNGTNNSNAKFALSNGRMWGSNTLANDIHFLTNYQLGDTTATTIVLNGNLTQANETTLTIGTHAETNVTFGGAGTVISDLRISAGKLTMNAGQATIKGSQSLVGNLEINNGATVYVGETDSLKYGATNTITVNAGGVLDFGSNRWTIGANNSFVLAGGTIQGAGQSTNGAMDFYRSATVEATAGTTSVISANVKIRNEETNGTKATFAVGAGAKLTLSGVINGQGALNKTEAGELVVSGTNTYTGGTTIEGGVLTAQSASALGSGPIANAGTLELAAATGTVSNVISGAGAIKKTGTGTVTLAGTNTSYSGQTTVEAGTLVAGNARALGTGNVVVADGATLARGLTSGSVEIGGTLTTNGAAILSTGALNAGTAAFAVTGTVALDAGTIFNLSALETGMLISAGTVTFGDGSATPSLANFLLNGNVFGNRTNLTVSNTGGVLAIDSVTQNALALTWAGGDSGTWKANGSGWNVTETGDAETFQVGDSVEFTSPNAGTVSVEGNVTVDTMKVSSGTYTFDAASGGGKIFSTGAVSVESGATMNLNVDSAFGGDFTVKGGGTASVSGSMMSTHALTVDGNARFTAAGTFATISVDGTLSTTAALTSTGTLSVDGTLTSSAAVSATQLSGSGRIDLGSTGTLTLSNSTKFNNWTGTVALQGSRGASVSAFNLNDYGRDGSKIVLNGVTGTNFYFNNVTGNAQTFAMDIELAGGSEGGLTLTNGYSDMVYTFSGAITGDGKWKATPPSSGAPKQQYVFTGDVSGYSGTMTLINASLLTFGDGGAGVTGGGKSVSGTGTISMASANAKVTYNYRNDVLASTTLVGGLGVKKQGAGSLTLTGTNTYTGGTTIENGTLVAANANALGSGAVTVNSDAKLQVKAGMNVTVSTANSTTVTIAEGAKLVIDFAGVDLPAGAEERTFAIMTAAVFLIYGTTLSGDDVTTRMAGAWELLNGDEAWLDSAKWTLADNTLSLTLTIPEPSVFGLLAGLGALALAGTRRRRKKA